MSGIIDWGDVHAGDVAVDLGIAYTLFPPSGRRRFFAAYGDLDRDTHLLARFRAASHTLAVLEYAALCGYQDLQEETCNALKLISRD